MVTISLWWSVSIGALVREAYLEQSCYQRAHHEPYDGNHQQSQSIPPFIGKVKQNVLCDWHWLMDIQQSVLQWYGRSKEPTQWWLLVLQSCWMLCVPCATSCVQGTYVVWSSKGIEWCRWTYLLRGDIKQLVVEWSGTIVELHHSCDDTDRLNSYGGRLSYYCPFIQQIRPDTSYTQFRWQEGMTSIF